jgi:magnesium-transporting ATPase (P-type)
MDMPIPPAFANALPAQSATAAQDGQASGLSSEEARRRLQKFGPNAMPDTALHPLRRGLGKFWAPVPWMLEATIVLELVLGKYVEAAIIAALLVFNAALGLFQESRARATLAALKSRLALNASVLRDAAWKMVPAGELVPGDLVKLSLGGVVAADVKLTAGDVLLDQSMLTGESVPIDAGPGLQTFAGALVRRGEAVAEVTATGTRTKFGRTAELVRTAHVVSSQQKAVLRVVRNLAAFNGVVIMMLVSYAYFLKMPFAEIVPLVLTAILASIPVALPATFTLAAALGARALAKLGVLSTRLSAVDEAGTTDVLCADKTGTLTQNALTVTTVHPHDGRRMGEADDRGKGALHDTLRCPHRISCARLGHLFRRIERHEIDHFECIGNPLARRGGANRAVDRIPDHHQNWRARPAPEHAPRRIQLTPLLMVIVMITGDFLSMALTTDNVRPSPAPNAWRIGRVTMAGVAMGICLLVFCTSVLAVGEFGMNFGTEALRTLAFIVLVFGSQATIYAIRERQHWWGSRPSLVLVVSSVADIAIASTLAVAGIAMARLPALLVAGTLAAAVIFAIILDLAKVPIFAFFGIAQSPVTRLTPRIAKTKGIPTNESMQSPRTVGQKGTR